jgi:hypothetical protein
VTATTTPTARATARQPETARPTTLLLPCLIGGRPECLSAACDPLTQTVTVELGTGDTATLAAGQLVRLLDCLRVEPDAPAERPCRVCGVPVDTYSDRPPVCTGCNPFS